MAVAVNTAAPPQNGGFARLKERFEYKAKQWQVPPEQVLDLISQLSIMFETGLNLAAALEVLEKQSTGPMGELVRNIREGVEDGKPLSQAMGEHPWAFNTVALALVRAGEMTGDLGTMLRKVAEFMERDIGTRKKVRGAMSYPAFMAFLATCVVIFLLIHVFPKFADLFGDRSKLPGPTRFFLNLSDFVQAHGMWLFPTLIVGSIAAITVMRSNKGREIFDPFWLRLPAFGPLIKAVAISRAFHVLGVMLGSGLNVLEALRTAADVSGNHEYEKLWTQSRIDVEQGGDISASLLDNPLVPGTETAMVSLGERSGTLPEVLSKITQHHEKKVEGAIKAFVSTIEPAMTIIMGLVVALIVMSLIMPMFNLSAALKN